MAEEADAPALELVKEPDAYPNLDGVSLDEKRRAWCLRQAIAECAALADVLKHAPEWDRWLQHGRRPRAVEPEPKE